MASTKFEVSMEIFKFQGEPDVSITLTGKSPAELDTALKTLETIAKTTTLYDGDSAPEAAKTPSSPKLWRKCRSSPKLFASSKSASASMIPRSTGRRRKYTRTSRRKLLMFSSCWCSSLQFLTPMSW